MKYLKLGLILMSILGIFGAHAEGNVFFTQSSTVGEVVSDPAFGDFGRLLFPVDRTVTEDMTLKEESSSSVYVWYNYIDASRTVSVVNELRERSLAGEQIFYSIYSDAEIAATLVICSLLRIGSLSAAIAATAACPAATASTRT